MYYILACSCMHESQMPASLAAVGPAGACMAGGGGTMAAAAAPWRRQCWSCEPSPVRCTAPIFILISRSELVLIIQMAINAPCQARRQLGPTVMPARTVQQGGVRPIAIVKRDAEQRKAGCGAARGSGNTHLSRRGGPLGCGRKCANNNGSKSCGCGRRRRRNHARVNWMEGRLSANCSSCWGGKLLTWPCMQLHQLAGLYHEVQ